MAWVSPAVGGLGSLLGGIGQKGANASTGKAAETAATSQAQLANQQMSAIQPLIDAWKQYYAPQQAGAAAAAGGLQGVAGQAGGLAQNYVDQLNNPNAGGTNVTGALQGLSGVLGGPTALSRALPGVQNFLGGPTQLGAATPDLQSFYKGEMQNGINPQFAQNAQNQLLQGFQTTQNNILEHARPGQNLNPLEQEAQNNLLTQQANLGGQLAGQSQAVAQQGAQGLQSTASGIDAQKMQMLQQMLANAGMSDEQAAQFAQQLFTTQNQFAQQRQGAAGTAAQTGQGAFATILDFINQGRSVVPGAAQQLGNLSSQYGQMAQNAASNLANAPNPFTGITQGLGQLAGAFGGNRGGGGTSPIDVSGVGLSTPPAGQLGNVNTGLWQPG